MKITGTSSWIEFDLENGYVLRANCEMLVGNKFVVYKDTMKFWGKPHEKEMVTEQEKEMIVHEVMKNTNENTIKIIFE